MIKMNDKKDEIMNLKRFRQNQSHIEMAPDGYRPTPEGTASQFRIHE